MKAKKIILYFLVTIGITFLTSVIVSVHADIGAETANELTIVVIGLKSDTGSVVIKLFNSKGSYSVKDSKAFMERSVLIKDHKTEAKFIDLMPGEYAIKLYHDENGNCKHDKGFLGIPKEDYAFSNNAIGIIGPPEYEKVKFEIKNDLIMTIYISKKNK